MTPTFAYLKGLITLMYYYAHFKNIEMHVNANLRIRTSTQAANLCQNSRNNWNPGCVYLSALKDFSFSPLMSASKALREFVNPLNSRYSLIKSSKYWWAIFKFRKIVKNFPLTTCQNETYNRRISKENPWKHN